MKNIDRLAAHITKNGARGYLIHTLPDSSNWIVCEKIKPDKWALTLCNPMGNVFYNLGIVSEKQHLALWDEITKINIERKTSQILLAKELKSRIQNFLRNYRNHYKKFIKRHEKETSKKDKHLGRRTSKTQSSNTNPRMSNRLKPVQKRT